MPFFKTWSMMKRFNLILLLLVVESFLFAIFIQAPLTSWLMLVCVYLLIGVLYIFLITVPHRRLENQLERFNRGYDSKIIFNLELYYSESLEKALRKIQAMLDNQQSIQLTNRQAQYLALQNQINPHFLYNTLEAIRGDALSEGLATIAETTEALATFFRYTISNVDSLVTLEEELGNAENYFAIQNYRFGDKMHLQIDIEEGDIDLRSCLIPKLTLQPIIENAIIHGLENKIGKGMVSLQIGCDGKRLLIQILDDGIGMSEEILLGIRGRLHSTATHKTDEDKVKMGGIALNNVNARIQLLFGEAYGIGIASVPNLGTRVEINLPIQFEGNR